MRMLLRQVTQSAFGLLFGISLLAGVSRALASEPAVVTVAAEPRQTMTYGMDFERLWSWDMLKDKQRLAELAVRDCRVDYVRVAVSGGAEPEEGRFEPKAYDQILDCMRTLRRAQPDIRFFAVPQPIHVTVSNAPYTCFPLWISEHDEKGRFRRFHWDKAADYLVRYLRFMKAQGLPVAYLDVKNEVCRKVRPDEASRMVARMRAQLGADMPRMLAPSSYDYQVGTAWLREAAEGPGVGFFDIASTHNTKTRGSLEEFVRLAREHGKEVWNTELHGWYGPDAMAVSNSAALFRQVRAGVSGMNDWLSLGNQKKEHKMFRALDDGSLAVMRTYYIYRTLVNTSGGGRYVPTSVPDALTATMGFLQGNLLTVWLLNTSDAAVDTVSLALGKRTVEGDTVQSTSWGPADGPEGTTNRRPATVSANTFPCSVPARTLVCLAVTVRQQ